MSVFGPIRRVADQLKGRKAVRPAPTAEERRAANVKIMVSLVVLVVAMGGLARASVPLYQLFCQVTGFGGTTQRAERAPEATAQARPRMMTVRFNTDVAGDLGWSFGPDQPSVTLAVGETKLVSFHAINHGQRAVTGQATYNVTPDKSGPYFDKLQCFCFEKQTLAAGERAQMPVSFFIDPAILADHNLDDVDTITLSYAFFRAKEQPKDTPVAASGESPRALPASSDGATKLLPVASKPPV